MRDRRLHIRPIPRLGGIALLLGIFVPALAFLTLDGPYRGILLGAAVATCVGVVDDFRGLSWWAKLGGQSIAAAIPLGFGIAIDRFTFPFLGIQEFPAWIGVPVTFIWIVAIMNMVNFLDGMDGLAAGICAIAGSTFAVIALSLGKPEAAILSAIVAGACFGFLRHNFYPATDLHGRLGSAAARLHSRDALDSGPPEDGGHRRPVLPAARARDPDRGHVVRPRQAAEARASAARGRSHPPPSPLREHRVLAAAGRSLHVRLVRDARRRGLGDAVHPIPRARHWHLWPTLAAAAIGLAALATSIYIVYLLEIVKLANPRIRRREQAERERKTA